MLCHISDTRGASRLADKQRELNAVIACFQNPDMTQKLTNQV